MSDSVSNHPRSTTTRRALIGGLTLGAAAVVAETVRPSSAHAATGDPVIAGADNRAGNLTRLTNTADLSSTDPGHALYVAGASVDGSAIIARNYGRTDPAIRATAEQNHGVSGETFNDFYSGVLGANSALGNGVTGRARGEVASGVYGVNTSGYGVYGQTDNSIRAGVYGQNNGGTGVGGHSASANASGVYGQNDGGGFGVAGVSNRPGGTGVYGNAIGTGGVALLGISNDEDFTSTALKVEGKTQFSRSGTKRIPAGAQNVLVSLPGVTRASIVLATLQTHVSGYHLEGAVSRAGSFTLWLNQPAPTGGLPVGWFVIN
jgi:hypothetical protein